MRTIFLTVILALVAGCGGGRSDGPRNADYRSASFASGPVSRACMTSDRKARNPQLCGCLQNAANIELNSSDQRMAVSFYGDPHKAQEIRQSDRANHEAFWKRYTSYVKRAEGMCA